MGESHDMFLFFFLAGWPAGDSHENLGLTPAVEFERPAVISNVSRHFERPAEISNVRPRFRSSGRDFERLAEIPTVEAWKVGKLHDSHTFGAF